MKLKYLQAKEDFTVSYYYVVDYEVPPISHIVKTGTKLSLQIGLFRTVTEIVLEGEKIIPSCGWAKNGTLRDLLKVCNEISESEFNRTSFTNSPNQLKCDACGSDIALVRVVNGDMILANFYECKNSSCLNKKMMTNIEMREHDRLGDIFEIRK